METNNNHFFIKTFEDRLSEYTGAPYVVLTDSGTSAIFLALKLYQKTHTIKCIDVPKNTYISVPQTIIQAGIDIKFKNIKWLGSYKLGETNIYDYTVGFKHQMYIKNTFQCLSFHQKKAIPIGKGGAILLDNKEDYDILKRMIWDGRDSSIGYASENPDDIIFGYHKYLSPDESAKGILLLNQYKFKPEHIKSSDDYSDISIFKNAYHE